jgi:hypothetical protein
MYDTSIFTRPYLERLYFQQYLTGLIVVLVIFAIIGGIVAYTKGRSVFGWALLCFFFGFIPLIVIAALPNLKEQNRYSHNSNYAENGKEKILQSIGKSWKDIFLENNLGEYIDIFEKNKLTDLNIIMELNESDLEKLGINVMGDRKNILKIFSHDSLLVSKVSDFNNDKSETKHFNSDEFETEFLKEIENDKEIIESGLFKWNYKDLLEKLLMIYPVSTRRDIENIEKKHGIEIAKKIVVKMLINKNYGT